MTMLEAVGIDKAFVLQLQGGVRIPVPTGHDFHAPASVLPYPGRRARVRRR